MSYDMFMFCRAFTHHGGVLSRSLLNSILLIKTAELSKLTVCVMTRFWEDQFNCTVQGL